MRMIDADALPSALFQKHVHYEEELEPILCFEDAVKVVEDAPTIDAIPIKWIMKWSNKRYRETQRDVSIVDVLAAWQKEQEGR